MSAAALWMFLIPILATGVFVLVVAGLLNDAPAQAQLKTIPTDQILPQITNTYAAKFICGVQQDRDITHVLDAQAGRYSTKINVHNNTGVRINFRKKIILLRGGEVPTNPTDNKPLERLDEDQAMEVVCLDIYKLLNIPLVNGQIPRYIEGFVILEVYHEPKTLMPPADPLDVEGIYTYRGELPGTPMLSPSDSGVSIAVVVFPAKSNGHPLHSIAPAISARYGTQQECEKQEKRSCKYLYAGTDSAGWYAE
jgi:hypothetical protein